MSKRVKRWGAMEKGCRFPYGSRGESEVLAISTREPGGLLLIIHTLGEPFYIGPDVEVLA